MARLNIERQKQLEPIRIEYAVERIKLLGYDIVYQDDTSIKFMYKGHIVTFFPYSGWATGKTIRDCRGLSKLLKQIENYSKKES